MQQFGIRCRELQPNRWRCDYNPRVQFVSSFLLMTMCGSARISATKARKSSLEVRSCGVCCNIRSAAALRALAGREAPSVEHSHRQPHHKLRVRLPPGNRLHTTVIVLQSNGEPTEATQTVSYQQCQVNPLWRVSV